MKPDRDWLARALKGTGPVSDPAATALQRWPQPVVDAWFTQPLRLAAVLLPLVGEGEEIEILLTRRTETLPEHPGQISLPGGRVEPGDATLADAALRETHEETGIHPQWVDILGYLPPQAIVSGYAITPVVGYVRAGHNLIADPVEVAEIFQVPLAFFMAPGNRRRVHRDRNGQRYQMTEWHFRGHRIWGATALIIENFCEFIVKTDSNE